VRVPCFGDSSSTSNQLKTELDRRKEVPVEQVVVRLIAVILVLCACVPVQAADRFDGRTWKVGYEASDAQQSITEYVLPSEKVEAWTELVTRQVVFDREHRIPTLKLLELIKNGFGSDCKNFKWTIVQQQPNNIVYEWSHSGCQGYPAQYEVSRLATCREGLCRWAYTTKRVPAGDSVKSQWRKIMDTLDPNGVP
jgi:hypothetical protein